MFEFLSKEKKVEAKIRKMSRPKTVIQVIGRELILAHGVDPDLAWNLMQVAKPAVQNGGRYNVRVYSAPQASKLGVVIHDYESLDNHLDLVLFHGWFTEKQNDSKLMAGADKS